MWLCRHASGNLHPSRRNSFWEARERKEGEENTQQAIMTTARRRLWQPHHRCPVHSHSCATGGAWVTWWGGWEGEQPTSSFCTGTRAILLCSPVNLAQ